MQSNAQTAVTAGTQVTSESNLVSGKAYLIQYTSLTGTPYITEDVDASIGKFYSAPNYQNSPTQASAFYFINDGSNWKIENAYTGNYWPTPSGNATLVPTEAANAGSWAISFANGDATLTCNNLGLDRLSGPNRVVSWSSRKTVQIFEVEAAVLSTATPYADFPDKDITVSASEAASISEGQWYVMKNRGRNGYAYEENGSLKNQETTPEGSASENAKFLVRFLSAGSGTFYLQNGLGNYFGAIPDNTAVPTTAVGTEKYTIGKINATDGHFYLTSETGNYVLDCQENGNPVVGWGTDIPTSTGGNNDWAFYPIELTESWLPTINDVYTINNTNIYRGAMMYNGTSNYVWSSGKSGTFDASEANCQWILVPTDTDKQYYLYNVGAGKFAIPTSTASTASWIFSADAVAVKFITQSDGTKKIKTATSDTYAAVSNGYDGPIINYNDIGGNFTITKVDGADASAAATAAVNRLIAKQTPLTAVPTGEGWYAIRIRSGIYANEFVYAPESEVAYQSGRNYPLTFMNDFNLQPAIGNPLYLTRIAATDNGYAWQLPNGKYLQKSTSNYFPTSTPEVIENVSITYSTSGIQFMHNGYKATPYLLNSMYFIGETANTGGYFDIYPIDLATASLTAWQMLCENAPESMMISCTRNDVSGLTEVYKNGYFFLPSGVMPAASDFSLDGASDVTIDQETHTVTFTYDPDLAIVAGGVSVAQGWQTAGRSGEVMLLRVNAAPFKDATNVSLSVSLKDGAESNISSLTLYEASSDSPEILSAGNSGAPIKTQVATQSISTADASFSIGNLNAGNHYYWLGATVKDDASLGSIIDAAVTSLTYTCNGKETVLDLTEVGDPADRGAMIFNVHSYPFLPREDGSRVYRIPAMTVANDGSIVVACDKRYDSATDIGGGHVIDIVARRSTDGGKTWSDPITVAKGQGAADNDKCGYGDPSLYKDNDGKLYLLFAAGNTGYFYGLKRVCMSTSSDNGATWTAPVDLYGTRMTDHATSYGENTCYGLYDYFVTSGHGICTSEGYIMGLLPAQAYTDEGKTSHTSNSQDYVFYSTDKGETWHISENAIFAGGDEAKVTQANDGSLIASVRQSNNRGFNTATYTKNDDGTLSFVMGSQWNNPQLNAGGYANNQDILYYQRETKTGKTDVIFHSMTTGQHANFKLYYSTDQGRNWTEFLTVQTKGTRYVTMEKGGSDNEPGSLYLFFEDQSLNSAAAYTDYNHYPLNFLEITREQLLQYIPALDKSALEEHVKVVYDLNSETTYGSWSGLTWTSNDASGLAGLNMTLSDGTHDRFSNLNSHYNLAYHPAAANTNSTITLTAPEGYVITDYSALTGVFQAATYTLTAGGEQITPANLGTTYTPIEVSGLTASSVTIDVTTTDASKWLAIADFVVTLSPVYKYTRAVTPGRWGTVCVPGAVAAADINGAEIYRIAGKTLNAEQVPTSLKAEQVENMEAGKPLPSEEQITLTYYAGTVVVTPGSENGLVGSFIPMDVDPGYYILSNNKIVLCGTDCNIGANRAYIDMDAVPLYTDASGVKSIAVISDDPDGISLITDSAPEGDECIYDLSGRSIGGGTLPRGIYIKNGRKVVIK